MGGEGSYWWGDGRGGELLVGWWHVVVLVVGREGCVGDLPVVMLVGLVAKVDIRLVKVVVMAPMGSVVVDVVAGGGGGGRIVSGGGCDGSGGGGT